MGDGNEFYSQEQMERFEQRTADAAEQEEFEHDAAQACIELAGDVVKTIDMYGLTHLNAALKRYGYELTNVARG